jgi:glyoxylase-like metal-dependent hydrolase (beta-lactamase superfamily II)
VKYVAVSHTHGDHIGNVEMFPRAMLLVQRAEYEWPTPFGVARFRPSHPVTKLEGDHDVFGDGSVMLLSTPGHTPGHQSILIKLAKTGAIVISGDAVHFKDNWDNRRVPVFNVDKEKSLASMQRLADVVREHKAELWIHHDVAQSERQRKAPAFYD